jgi:hypothetical protein
MAGASASSSKAQHLAWWTHQRFTTMAMYLPKEDVYVVVLSNCDCVSPEKVDCKACSGCHWKAIHSKELTLTNSILQTYEGVYENENGDLRIISVENGKLYSQIGRNRKISAKAFKKDNFFFDDPMITMEFSGNKSGNIDRLTIHSRIGNEVWNKSDKPVLAQAEIKLDEKILAMYTGEYEVSPQFSFYHHQRKGPAFPTGNGPGKNGDVCRNE